MYVINVTYSDNTSHIIYRRYSKFFDLQVTLRLLLRLGFMVPPEVSLDQNLIAWLGPRWVGAGVVCAPQPGGEAAATVPLGSSSCRLHDQNVRQLSAIFIQHEPPQLNVACFTRFFIYSRFVLNNENVKYLHYADDASLSIHLMKLEALRLQPTGSGCFVAH